MKFAASLLLASASLAVAAPPLMAQPVRPNEVRVEAIASGEEQLNQSDLWVMDVYFKPLGLVPVTMTNPKTGEKSTENVLYVAYRAFNRPLSKRGLENVPVNEFDPPVSQPLFVPEFTLLASDGATQKVYQDVVVPEAVAVINRREKTKYKSSVEIVGPVPETVDRRAPDAAEKGVSGVAVFRGVDPDADFFTLYMTGFSNGIRRVPGKDGKTIVQTKTIQQKFNRPGDRFDAREPEYRLDGEWQWIYR